MKVLFFWLRPMGRGKRSFPGIFSLNVCLGGGGKRGEGLEGWIIINHGRGWREINWKDSSETNKTPSFINWIINWKIIINCVMNSNNYCSEYSLRLENYG